MWWKDEKLPKEGTKLIIQNNQLLFMTGERRYFLKSLTSPISKDSLAIVLFVYVDDEHFFVDRANLNTGDEIRKVSVSIAKELGVLNAIVSTELSEFIPYIAQHRDAVLHNASVISRS